MIIQATDGQVVGESSSTLFSTIQQGPVTMLVILQNGGTNAIVYRFQEFNGTAWVDLGASGTDYYNTLIVDQVRQMKISSNYPQVQLVGYASGGSYLTFSLTRYCTRASGGSVPILNL